MIVLDTTVLVYAKGGEHPLRDPCRELIIAAAEGRLRATTSVEAIQEFVHVRARRCGRADAAALGSDYVEILAPLLILNTEHLRRGLQIYSQLDSLGAFDAVLAAAAHAAGASAFLSADRGFAAVRDLPYLIPSAETIAELLR
jgi:predicted nucleic acid-binding protein